MVRHPGARRRLRYALALWRGRRSLVRARGDPLATYLAHIALERVRLRGPLWRIRPRQSGPVGGRLA